MDTLTTKLYDTVKSYWRRRGYQRLTTIHDGHEEEEFRLRPRRKWRIRIAPRLKLKLARSPRKMLVGLRDDYVRIMMKLANTPAVRERTMIGCNGDGLGKMVIKEVDEKIIIEIYKNVVNGKYHQH